MRDLTAQVTSSLLPFPGVTIDALGEDEITLDSVLQGKFTVGRSGVAWLACGPQLEVVHAVTGERLSAYCFSGEGEHPPNILAARDFSWLKRSGLLVGLEEVEGSMLCLYDLSLSRVVKAVVIPGRITSIEPLVSYGGASTSTQHLHQSLRWFFGIAAVVTDLGHVLLVDLCLDDLSCSQSELEASDLEVVTKSPAEIPRLREASSRQGRHLCLQLSGPSGTKATALQYISRTNQMAVGFSDGYLQLWNMKTLKKEYHAQLEAGEVPVYAFTFQEPENDPRNCCYLWAVQSAQELEGDVVSLHLLQLAFSERKCMASGKILYEGLEYCEERYSQDVSGAAFPLRAQATNTRLLSCQTIEKFRHHPDRDDSMNEVASPDTSVSIFSWQVKAYGQGKPTTCIGVFDINRWYHAQMPDSLRAGESLHSCPYLAVWSLDPVVEMVSPRPLLDIIVHDRSLSRGLPCTWPPPEQFFNPTTYNFATPCSSDFICSSYTRCLMSGLLSSRQAGGHHGTPSQEEQLDAILCTAVETSSLGLITGCIKQWTAEEQPGSALNLRYILEWAWNKVVHTKEELDGICAPLFDSSSNFTDPQTLQLLQHSQRLLGNLSAIFHCLLSEAKELTQRGLMGLMNKNMVSSLISQYAQVVLWFCRTGLLPEGSDMDSLQISRPFYTHALISSFYTGRREELTRLAMGKWCADCLMIDGLVSQCGERLVNLWKRDEGGTGQYPPPTLHVIYLLLDVMYSFPNKGGASVESFPTAFAIPIGLVKLVQGLWLLDHQDHQRSVELLLHPTTSQCHFTWQHERVLQALMCQGQHTVALRYLHVTKPPLSSTSQAKLSLSVLLHNRCLVEAWSLLRQHSTRLSMVELLSFLYESCQELDLMKELLKLPLSLIEQECLEKYLQGTGGLQNRELLMVHYLQQANYIPALQLNHSLRTNPANERDPKMKERSNTRNAILDQYGKVLPRVQRRLAMERAKPYHHPSTSIIHREVNRPQPLSTIAKRSSKDTVMSRAGFINSVLTKIEEVWLGKGATPHSSVLKSPRASETQSPSSRPYSSTLTEPFLGTPISMTAKRKSRLMDLVVHPSCQTPRPLLSPLRAPGSVAPTRSISKATELDLLRTPQVVKRARALASAFTPHSILRSSLRPTPVATPSASPGRSVTPPLRSKESRITFGGEAASPQTAEGPLPWTNGMAADSEIRLLTRGSPLPSSALKHWASQSPDEEEEEEQQPPRVKFMPPAGGVSSLQLRGSESDSSSVQEATEATKSLGSLLLPPGSLPLRLSLGLDTSLTSVQSSDSTLEFHDAPLTVDPEEEEEEEEERVEEKQEEEEEEEDNNVVVLNINAPAEQDGPTVKSIAATDDEEVEEQSKAEVAQRGIASEEDDKMVCPQQQAQRHPEEEVIAVRLEEEGEGESASQQDRQPSLETQEPGYTDKVDVVPLDGDRGTVDAVVCEDLETPEKTFEQSEVTEHLETSKASEPLQEHSVCLDSTTDLTEFVERHLFGGDQSSLTRSGIHDTSDNWTSFDSEPVCEAPEEHKPVAEAPTLTSQKSVTSITSSELSGSDSHYEGLSHFLPSPSLIPAEAELKMVGDGEVVLLRLDETMNDGSGFTELKPSTLLVPLELVEGHGHSLVDAAQLNLTVLGNENEKDYPTSGSRSTFSLMLEMEEDVDPEADTLPLDNLQLAPVEEEEEEEAAPEPVEEEEAAPEPVEEEEAAPEPPVVEEEAAPVEEEEEEAATEPLEEEATEPLEEAATEPLEEEATEPLEEAATEPLEEAATEPLEEAATEPLEEAATEPLEEAAATEPLEEAAAATEPLEEAAATEPLEEEATEPLEEAATEPLEEAATEPLGEAATEPLGEEATEPLGEEATEPLEEEATEPLEEEATEPLEEEATEPLEEADSEDQQQTKPEEDAEERRGEFHKLQEESKRRTRTRASENHGDKDSHVRQVFSSQDPLDPEPSSEKATDSQKESKAPSTPTRKATRGRRVTFTSSTPEKASPSTAGRRTRSRVLAEVEEEPKEAINSTHDEGERSQAPTPAKRQARQSATPRRTSRSTTSVTEESEQVEEVQEKKPTRKKAVRISQIPYFEVPPSLLEVEGEEQVVPKATSSPSRVTRKSSRMSLGIQPQSKARTRGGASAAKPMETDALSEPVLTNDAPPTTKSRRLTRNKLWTHSDEDHPFLDPPLEVDSQTPVADALIKRLKDEEEKEATAIGSPVHKKTVSGSRRKTMSSVERVPSPPVAIDDDPAPEPGNDATKDTFIYSPSRRRTRNALPRSKAAPLAMPGLISPLPSPAAEAEEAQAPKRPEEGEAGGVRLNARRKRIMSTAFTKPVTRRKKL
ncbi:hypothetical protein NHX12_005935 [Muraenolepis orangiensis]|uniref:Protein ELYS n=1 Tax=Muraenolepis orangiensis TaxID=630683 RepID=A0A9Q0DSC7_9TELE|nr:hypothetical protein NHX12_005935 [Muraenolepis orangiensis]